MSKVPDSERCESIATHARFWPGFSPDKVCLAHAEDSQRIGSAMGFVVTIAPLLANDGNERCCCSKGFSQTVNT